MITQKKNIKHSLHLCTPCAYVYISHIRVLYLIAERVRASLCRLWCVRDFVHMFTLHIYLYIVYICIYLTEFYGTMGSDYRMCEYKDCVGRLFGMALGVMWHNQIVRTISRYVCVCVCARWLTPLGKHGVDKHQSNSYSSLICGWMQRFRADFFFSTMRIAAVSNVYPPRHVRFE